MDGLFPTRHRLIVALVVTAAVTAGAFAYASIPDSGVIHGCYRKNSGDLRVIEAGKLCQPSEKSLDWQAGPAAPGGRVAQAAGDSVIPTFTLGQSQTVSITAPAAGYVLVQAWLTVSPLSANPGIAAAQLRDTGSGDTSNAQAIGLNNGLPGFIAVGWVFPVPAAGEYTYALDFGASPTNFAASSGSKTLTALYVPGGPNG